MATNVIHPKDLIRVLYRPNNQQICVANVQNHKENCTMGKQGQCYQVHNGITFSMASFIRSDR